VKEKEEKMCKQVALGVCIAVLTVGCGDHTAPEVEILSVLDGSLVGRTVYVNVVATDNKEVESVALYADDTIISTLMSEPYNFEWNTSSVTPDSAEHHIYALARDPSDNVGYSETLMVTVYNGGEGTIAWCCQDRYFDHTSMAVGVDGSLIAVCHQHIVALSSCGMQQWDVFRSGTGIGYLHGAPAIESDGMVYVTTLLGGLDALTADGVLLWESGYGNTESSVAIGSDGTIYSINIDLYALNTDGSIKWRYDASSLYRVTPTIGSDGTIYVGLVDNCLAAISPSGALIWTYQAGDDITSSPCIGDDGAIYFGCRNGCLYAVNPDGTERWVYQTGDRIESSPVLGADGTVYVGSRDHSLYAINVSGSLVWQYATDDMIVGAAAVSSDGTIYFGSLDDSIYALNPDGTLKWKYDTGESVYCSPAIVDGFLYVSTYDHYLFAINITGDAANSNWPMFQHDPQRTGRSQ
jgi:outer membrane protein assembly factor BamB